MRVRLILPLLIPSFCLFSCFGFCLSLCTLPHWTQWAFLACAHIDHINNRCRYVNLFRSEFTDFYDFDDAKLKVGAEWAFSPKLSLIGESMDVLDHGSDTAYLGIRARF